MHSASGLSDRLAWGATMDGAGTAATGRRQALLDRIIGEHADALRRFLQSRVADPSEREDIAQDAFVRLSDYRALSELDNPRAFLFRIAENLIHDRRRRGTTRAGLNAALPDGLEAPDPAPPADVVLQHRQALARVEAAILALDEPARTAFLLSRYHDMSYAQIALHLGVSVKTVEKYISSALVVLRRAIGSDPSDASIRTESPS